jgi:hypothetical protein
MTETGTFDAGGAEARSWDTVAELYHTCFIGLIMTIVTRRSARQQAALLHHCGLIAISIPRRPLGCASPRKAMQLNSHFIVALAKAQGDAVVIGRRRAARQADDMAADGGHSRAASRRRRHLDQCPARRALRPQPPPRDAVGAVRG